MFFRLVISFFLLSALLTADYAASDTGIALGNLSVMAQSSETYASVPDSPAVFEIVSVFGLNPPLVSENNPVQSTASVSLLTLGPVTKMTRPLAYPTLFDPTKENTRLYFELHDASAVAVKIYTIGGMLVKTIELNAVAGINYVVWDGQSSFRNTQLDSGVYLFYVVGKSKVYGRGKVILMRGR